ncbi:MAG: sodium:proton antiporter [Nitriliruptorales bacterium]|nr:sodium:proton antiporter [Nitriliruptorales bacterium]
MVLAALDTHSLTYAVAGIAALAGAVLPRLVRDAPVTTPLACLGMGLILFSLPLPLDAPDPLAYPHVTEYLTEVGVIVSLMGAGLKLDRPVGWKPWASTWRLLAVTMPLTIAGTALLGWWMVGLAPAAALLLGAVVAPTDPVLASDVQVGPPGAAMEDVDHPHDAEEEVRFALTSEAGLNDSLAFPFTNLAIAVSVAGVAPDGWFGEWLAVDVVYRLAVGLVLGVVLGRMLGRLVFGTRGELQLAKAGEGFVALAATFLAYGLTELVGGYGFLAVFVTAVTLRHYERGHEYHTTLHDFAEQTERLLMIALLLLLGEAVGGGLLHALTWQAVVATLVIILVVRPGATWLFLPRDCLNPAERTVVAFFGIRGIGSLFYLAHGLNRAEFAQAERLWAVVGLIVVVSVVLHGISVTPAMRLLDRRRGRAAAQ